jgi:hypothetical protein
MATGALARGWRRLRVVSVLAVCVLALCGATAGPVARAAAGADGPSLTANALRVNSLTDPIGLGDTSPNLSWSLSAGEVSGSLTARQTAYEIQVASARAKLGHATAWSAPGSREMGLLSQSDWSAKWIEDPGYTYATDGVPNPLPIFAKAFDLSGRIVKARLYITGLGQYTARLNGLPVTDAVLEPGQTSYWAEVDYRTYDVTRLLRSGSNVLGIETGSGAYQQADSTSAGRYMFQPGNNTVFGTPKVIAQLEVSYADGAKQTIATDPSWLTELGPTTFSSWWGGEDYDARRIPADWNASAGNLAGPGWSHASLATLTSSTIPRATTPLVANPRPPVTVAGEATTLAAPAADGDTNIKVASTGTPCNPGGACTGTTSFIVGQTLLVDSGTAQQAVTVTAVGTAGAAGTGVTFSPALSAAHAAGISVRDAGTGVTVTPGLHLSHAGGAAAVSVPGPAYVLDFGANLAGLPEITGSAPAGTTVTMVPAEQVNSDGTINIASTGASPASQILYDYTFAGHGTETWHAQFTYNGFQYLEVRGLPRPSAPDTITLLVTHAANQPTASFESSSPMLNTIYAITKRALENNMQSVLTDCPDREEGRTPATTSRTSRRTSPCSTCRPTKGN